MSAQAEKMPPIEGKGAQIGVLEGEARDRKKKVESSITQRSSSSGSRSESARSRSREGKKPKNKHKHKKRHSKSKQNQHQRRSKERDHKKKKTYDRDYRDRRERRDYHPASIATKDNKEVKPKQKEEKLLPTQIPMPVIPTEVAIPGQKRRRQRSRSPLGYYRRNQNNNDGEFWDSFSWVPRMNFLPNVTNSALVNTKKMRRLMITNIPYEIGITEQDLRNLITRFMADNYLKDQMNSCPVLNLEINQDDHNVAVQLSSVEETCRLCKLEKIELFKGTINGIIRLGDSCYGNNVVAQAQTAGQAMATAYAAMDVLQNKRTNFSVDNVKNASSQNSTLLRIVNGVTPYMAGQLSKEQWNEYEEDLLAGFSEFGTIVHHWFVTKDQKDICADPGNLFIEYESKKDAERAMEEMQGRAYDERIISIFYVPRDLYYQNYQKNITPPAIKDVKK